MDTKYNVLILCALGIIFSLPSNFEKCLLMFFLAALIGVSMFSISIEELQKKINEERMNGNTSVPEKSEATFQNIVSRALTYSGWRKSLLERNMKIDCLAALIVIFTGIVIGGSATEWSLALIIVGEIIIGESMNTVIEDMADKTTTNEDPKIKKSKDIAAGAVLIQAFTALCITYLLFLPKIIMALF